jgi:hypothetical protein
METCRDGWAGVSRGHSIRLGRRRAESFIQGAALHVSRDMERQQVARYQMELPLDAVSHGAFGDGGTESEASEERQMPPVADKKQALTQDLMERVAGRGLPVEAREEGGVYGHGRRRVLHTGTGSECFRPEFDDPTGFLRVVLPGTEFLFGQRVPLCTVYGHIVGHSCGQAPA